MKELTKKQRAAIYLKVAEIVSRPDYYAGNYEQGLCYLVNKAKGIYNYAGICDFPELELFKPNKEEGEGRYYRWWTEDDSASRVICMLLCYQMCK